MDIVNLTLYNALFIEIRTRQNMSTEKKSVENVINEHETTKKMALSIAYPHVLEYLGFREAVLLSRVNRQAHSFAMRPVVWLMMCQKYLYRFPPRNITNSVDPTIDYHHAFLEQIKKTTLHMPQHEQLLFKLIVENEVVRATKFLDLILSQGFIIDNYHARFQSFLVLACSKNLTAMVKLLLAKGADINHRHNKSALPIAGMMGHLGVVKVLIDHNVAINQEDKEDGTALFYACSENHTEVARFLIEKRADVNHSAKCTSNATPLISAAARGHQNIAELLIKAKANPNKLTHLKASALILASQNGHLSIVNTLVRHDKQINHRNFENKTALFFAVKHGHTKVAASLLENKADPNICDEDGTSPLSIAEKQGNSELIRLISKSTT